MKKSIIKIVSVISLAFLLLPSALLAADPITNLTQATPDLIKGNLPSLIGSFIQAVLGLLGIIFVILIIYAGFIWMTAGGDASKITKAKGIITAAITGLAIVLLSYAITFFVISSITGEI